MIISEPLTSPSLFDFVLFTVIPVAFRELLHWLYDWQILVCGVLALIAARLWGRSVIRAARINARAKIIAADTRRAAEPVVVPTPLAAEAVEQILSGRNGVYDITVTNRAGETVALFRGKSAQIRGTVIPVAD